MEDVELRRQFATIGKRFDVIDSRFDGLDKRFNTFEQNIVEQIDSLAAITGKNFIDLEERIDRKFIDFEKRLNLKIDAAMREGSSL